MNKTELVSAMAEKSGLTKKDSELALNAMVSSIEVALQESEKVVLVGFGTWEVRDRKERQGRNPRTKEPITIPASKAAVFKAGKRLKEIIK